MSVIFIPVFVIGYEVCQDGLTIEAEATDGTVTRYHSCYAGPLASPVQFGYVLFSFIFHSNMLYLFSPFCLPTVHLLSRPAKLFGINSK